MKLMVNTIFDRQETVVESKDPVQALLSQLPTHSCAEAAIGLDSATQSRREGL